MENNGGYRDCACRDCFETTVGEKDAMCSECDDAGCGYDSECQAPHAYGSHCGEVECCGSQEVK
jgi:hypothetical protein